MYVSYTVLFKLVYKAFVKVLSVLQNISLYMVSPKINPHTCSVYR